VGNRTRILLLLLCLVPFQAEARFPNAFAGTQQSVVQAQTSGEVSFQLVHSSLILVQGSLNEVKGRNVLIDTGSNPTVLDVQMARKLGLAGEANGLRTLDGNIHGRIGSLSSLRLGPIAAKSVPVFIADLSFMKRDTGTTIDAVVGLDLLQVNDLTIDYNARRILLGPASPYQHSIRFESGPPLITVDMEIDGQPRRMLVDTGAEGLFLFHNQSSQMPETAVTQKSTQVSLLNHKLVEIPTVRLGELHRRSQPAYVVPIHDPSLRDFDGLFGPRALGIHIVIFDFKNRRLAWN
jgi:predicted aspartyl protease